MENHEDDAAIISQFSSVLVCGGDNSLKQRIEKLQCPFTWQPKEDVLTNNSDVCNKVLSLTEIKLKGNEDNEDNERYASWWTKFILNVLLCYEYAKSGVLEEAFRKQEECMMILRNAEVIPHMPTIGIGLNHVALACKVFLLIKNEKHNQVTNLLKEIPNFDDMGPKDQASILALRGALLLEYSAKGMKESIPFFEDAIKLDPNCGELHFLLGKSLGRVRRIEALGSRPCNLEVESLEYAAKTCNSAFVNVLLAYSYKDIAFSLKNTLECDRKNEENLMNQKAMDIYRKTFQEGNCTRSVLARIASGLLDLPKERQDLKTAEECVKKALEMSANDSYLNIIAGKLYFRKKDYFQADKYFSVAAKFGNFYAVEQLFIVRVKTPYYNPVHDIDKYLKDKNFAAPQYQHKLLSLKGIYYYKIENDFKKALQCWNVILNEDIQSNVLKELKNPWEKWPFISHIHEIIVGELTERMQEEISDKNESDMYKQVLKLYKQNFPDLVNILCQ